MATMRPIIIVGSGMAGYSLAREFRKLNKEQSLIMITTDDASNYAKPTLSNALVGNKAPDQIALGDAEKMRTQLDMTILTETWVKAINAEQHQIEIETSDQISTLDYEKLVLAVGANPIRLAISGDGADDIFMVNNLNDYKAFRNHLDQRAEKRVLILGAGLIGCEFANDLRNTDHDVTVVDLAPRPLGRLLQNILPPLFKKTLNK